MTQSKVQIDQIAQEAANNGREGVECCIKSCGILFKGFEEIAKANASFVQNFAEKQAKFVNDSLKVKTLNEWSEIQNEAAQANFNDVMEACTSASEKCVKVLTEALEPINNQMNKSIRKASESIAA